MARYDTGHTSGLSLAAVWPGTTLNTRRRYDWLNKSRGLLLAERFVHKKTTHNLQQIGTRHAGNTGKPQWR